MQVTICKNIMWRCAAALLLLALQLAADTRLTAQGAAGAGASHGVIHDTLIDGITFQEWGGGGGGAEGGAQEGDGEANGAGAANGAGGVLSTDVVHLAPARLAFGACALGAVHARTVLLSNAGNATLHLASVSGTTPDFHASFFEAKSLPPRANTSFSVVFLARREGALDAHLYIHTSAGVHKYAVSGVGAPSEYRLAPLVDVRVPANASVASLLYLHNPHERAIQVREVYSSGAWLGLELPSGAGEGPQSLWTLPPHTTRPLVRLRLRAQHLPPAPPDQRQQRSLAHTAYVRIKLNDTAPPLVVCVEVTREAAGLYVQPQRVDAGPRGTGDPPLTLSVAVGNSGFGAAALHATWSPPHCDGLPPSDAAAAALDMTVLTSELVAHAPPRTAIALTMHWDRMAPVALGADGAWCSGELQLRPGSGSSAQARRLSVPYRAQLLPGTLRLEPAALSFVTAHRDEALREREVRARNQFAQPLHIAEIRADALLDRLFVRSEWRARSLPAGAECTLLRLRLRDYNATLTFSGDLLVVTNVSEYRLPVHVSSGRLHFEWEWPVPDGAGGSRPDVLDLGAVSTSSTRRVAGRLRNPGPAALCVTALGADMEGAALQFLPCAARDHHPADPCWCVEGGDSAPVSLALVAAAREGRAEGRVWVRTVHAQTDAPITMRAVRGKLRGIVPPLDRCAPSSWCRAPLQIESSMAAHMRLLALVPHPPDRALRYMPSAEGAAEFGAGKNVPGEVVFAPEETCGLRCYTGLRLDTTDGAAWAMRGRAVAEGGDAATEALLADAALLLERRALYRELPSQRLNFTLLLHTTEVVMVPVEGQARLHWPRLAARSVDAGLAAVGAASLFALRLRNPSSSHPLLVHAALGPALPALDRAESDEEWEACVARGCRWAGDAFRLLRWTGSARPWPQEPLLLLPPEGELELQLEFTPRAPATLATLLYLRNNLTALERVVVTGAGAFPSFKFGNRRAGSGAPLLFELTERHLRECSREAGVAPAAAGALTVRRTFTARNTGAIPVHVNAFLISGLRCEGYGYRVLDCAPFSLQPNATYKVEIAFTPDFTLSRVARTLSLRTSLGAPLNYTLLGTVPAQLLPACTAALARPAWEPYLRNATVSLMICLGLAVLTAGFLDADRVLKLATRDRPPRTHRPLDLRALNHNHHHHHHHWQNGWPACARAPPPPPPHWPEPEAPPPVPPRPPPAPRPPSADEPAPSRYEDPPPHRPRRKASRRAAQDPAGAGDVACPAPETDEPAPQREPSPSEPPAPSVEHEAADPQPPDDEDSTSTGTDLSAGDDPDKDGGPCAQSAERPRREPAPPSAAPLAPGPDHPDDVRPQRVRRDHATPTRRHDDRQRSDGRHPLDAEGKPRPPLAKYPLKKDRPSKKRPERVYGAAARGDPAPGGACPPAIPAAAPAARPAWGATFSEVVAQSGTSLYSTVLAPRRTDSRPAGDESATATPAPCVPRPLGPIGSNYQRRALEEGAGQYSPPPPPAPQAPPPLPDNNSLFYFGNDTAANPDVGVIGKPPPPLPLPLATTLDGPATLDAWDGRAQAPLYTGSMGGGLWGRAEEAPGWAAPWGGYGVRPPPGFAPHPAQPPQPMRPFDPFQSLSSIWAPGALHHLRREPDQ